LRYRRHNASGWQKRYRHEPRNFDAVHQEDDNSDGDSDSTEVDVVNQRQFASRKENIDLCVVDVAEDKPRKCPARAKHAEVVRI
jgi:hypothetical protein